MTTTAPTTNPAEIHVTDMTDRPQAGRDERQEPPHTREDFLRDLAQVSRRTGEKPPLETE